jgi:hypothetical protein
VVLGVLGKDGVVPNGTREETGWTAEVFGVTVLDSMLYKDSRVDVLLRVDLS